MADNIAKKREEFKMGRLFYNPFTYALKYKYKIFIIVNIKIHTFPIRHP
ncbi:MAG TPA: hypothetical protein DHV15_00580 [Treponema sp.]|uniref:Uncharacterized protein n=1 Tax=Treponema denticola (strain ATCC 35405 / DSM 14222 / CIP 103919 / JCM 8153 / KCTC 15104) TaxID=243275 RepID=Q73P49_TREDE|nr:hypothetical protein TDE_0950 [Treponema denticola ATCC 35405]HCY93996.1 hypothetical protein [Treponema sp.]